MQDQPRRRSPWWVRQMSTRQVHGTAMRIESLWRSEGVSAEQKWLFDCCVSELAYRRRHLPVADWCMCNLCLSSVVEAPRAPRRRRREGSVAPEEPGCPEERSESSTGPDKEMQGPFED